MPKNVDIVRNPDGDGEFKTHAWVATRFGNKRIAVHFDRLSSTEIVVRGAFYPSDYTECKLDVAQLAKVTGTIRNRLAKGGAS